MLRELSLRKALQDARDRRGRELEEVVQRSQSLRRRLRELTDRSLALGSVHARFFAETPTASEAAPTPAPAPASSPILEESASVVAPPPAVAVVAAPLLPVKRPEEGHEKLIAALSVRHPEGFTVGQVRELLDEVEGRTHTYDFAWSFANSLQRAHVFDVAGSRPGPTGPIRVFRLARRPAPASAPTEAR